MKKQRLIELETALSTEHARSVALLKTDAINRAGQVDPAFGAVNAISEIIRIEAAIAWVSAQLSGYCAISGCDRPACNQGQCGAPLCEHHVEDS